MIELSNNRFLPTAAPRSPRFGRFSPVKPVKPSMVKLPVMSPDNEKLLEKLSKWEWRSGKRANGRFFKKGTKWMAELQYTSGAKRLVSKPVEQAVDGTLFVRFNRDGADFVSGIKEDDIKTREYIMWNREPHTFKTAKGEILKAGPPRTWVHYYNEDKIVKATEEQEKRSEEILAECQRCFEGFTSTVLEFSKTCGVKVMWSSVPAELKQKYNVSDMKTFDSWCLDWEFDSAELYVGMKVHMRVDSVNCKGKYANKPLIRGVLLASAEKTTNDESSMLENISQIESLLSEEMKPVVA